MPRGNKHISEYGKKTRFSGKRAVKCAKKSVEVRQNNQRFREIFRDRLTDENIQELFEVLYSRAKHGDIRAFEVIRDTLGETTKRTRDKATSNEDVIARLIILEKGVREQGKKKAADEEKPLPL